MKTFAFILYLLAADGDVDRYIVDSGLSPTDCAYRLTLAESLATPLELDGDRFTVAAASCEIEQEV